MSYARQCFWCCVACIIGIAFASWVNIPIVFGFVAFLATFIFIVILFRFLCIRFFLLVFLAFLAGFLRHQVTQQERRGQENQIPYGQRVEFSGVVSGESERYIQYASFRVQVTSPWKGVTVLVNTSLYPRYTLKDRLRIQCVARAPSMLENDSYARYLLGQGITFVCSFPHIGIEGNEGKNILLSSLFELKGVLFTQLYRTISEPQASLLAALILGVRGGLEPSLKIAFERTGTSHIVAISGYNITLLASFLLSMFPWLHISRKRGFLLALCIIFIYVLITGASASARRAGIMGALVLLSRQMGRLRVAVNILLVSIVILLFISPKMLISDIGFQLSALSTLGLISFSPILQKYLKAIPSFLALRENIATTIAATLFTLPVVIYHFQQFSIVSILANILILPVIPLVMFSSMIALFVGFFSLQVASLMMGVPWIALTYIIAIVEFLSDFSFSLVEVHGRVSLLFVGIYFGLLFFLYRQLFYGREKK